MFPFSMYLATKNISSNLSPGEFRDVLPGWIKHLQAMLLEFKTKKLIAENTYEQCSKSMDEWIFNLEKHVQGLTVSSIDSIYQKLLYVVVNDMTLSPRRFELVQGYPFAAKISGVKLMVQLVTQDNQGNEIVIPQGTTQSLLGSYQGAALKKKINTKLGKIDWLSKGLAKLGKKISDIHTSDPHAEIIWCVDFSENLLKSLQKMAPLNPLNDEFPQSQLIQTPRLEVITSSSCCINCRLIFSALRMHLEELGIHLPIVLYADSPFNAGEIHGSVYVVLSDGNIFNTKVQCNTPGARYQFELPWGARYDLRSLSTKEQSDWDCLTLMGGFAILDLLKVGMTSEQLGTINPITYIAPDSLIIYAAEKWAHEPKLSKPLKTAIARLNNILANMDMMMLTWWRTAFTEQLHWLLISELDSKYREHARKHAYATNTNFTLRTDSESKGDEFCNDFYLLWGQLNNLRSAYRNVLDFFTEDNHARMPLGCMVGPLSMAMIKNHFPKDEAYHYLSLREEYVESEYYLSKPYSVTDNDFKDEKHATSDNAPSDSEEVQLNAQPDNFLLPPTGEALNQLGLFSGNLKNAEKREASFSTSIETTHEQC